MERLTYLDTHAVVWLYEGKTELLGRKALPLIEESDLWISPIVSLELQYLKEIKKITVPPEGIVGDLEARIGLRVCDLKFERVIETSRDLSWTRDPFDRIIVAHALARDAALISKDTTIRKHYSKTVW